MKKNTTPILLPFEPEKLLEGIRKVVREELQHDKTKTDTDTKFDTPGLVKKPLYKAEEVCKMIGVTRQTLHQWTRDGILKPAKIKSRVFFLWEDIDKLITPDR